MNIAFVLLTYAPDAPAGLERSIAALMTGLCGLGQLISLANDRSRPLRQHHFGQFLRRR